jgi:hypothetical protein
MVMAKKPAFALVHADEVKDHLRTIETKYHISDPIGYRVSSCSLNPLWRPVIGNP